MMKRTANSVDAMPRPPLPHEVALVAPPVLTAPRIPQHPLPKPNEFHDRTLTLIAIGMMTVAFASIATLTFAVSRQIDLASQAAMRPNRTFALSPAEPSAASLPTVTTSPQMPPSTCSPTWQTHQQIAMIAAKKLRPRWEPCRTATVRWFEELARNDALSLTDIDEERVPIVLPHSSEDSSCPMELAMALGEAKTSVSMANANQAIDESLQWIAEENAPHPEEWEEIGATGKIDGFVGSCWRIPDTLVPPASAPTGTTACDSTSYPSPSPDDAPSRDSAPDHPRTFGTRIVWSESMDVARKQAADEHKLLFVMHVSGNFEIEGFT